MNEQLEERLKTLETEFENGKRMLAELEAREATVRSSLLRISGAIQVLREFVPKTDPPKTDSPRTDSMEPSEAPQPSTVPAN